MSPAMTRRALVQCAGATLGGAAIPGILTELVAVLGPTASEATPTFDAAGFVAELRAAGFRVGMVLPATIDSEAPPWPSYFVRRPGGGAEPGWEELADRWRDAMEADPDYRDRVADFLEAERAGAGGGA